MSTKRKRRSRSGKRPAPKPAQAAAPKASEPARAGAPKRVSSADERPPAPWGSFPLAEIVILAGLVCLIVGLIVWDAETIAIGIVLAGLGGLEVAVREHFAGYRSHTTLIAGTVFVLAVGSIFYLAHEVLAVALAVGAVLFAIVFYLARRAFQRASGGLSYRIGGLRG